MLVAKVAAVLDLVSGLDDLLQVFLVGLVAVVHIGVQVFDQ